MDEETGLHYFGARYYDSRSSIWLSVDPLVEETVDSYGYCYQNPINLVDPDGMAPTDIVIIGANNSSITVKTNLVNIKVNASSLGVDFGGNYTLSGKDIVQAAVDIGGIFDPTGALDIIGAKMSYDNGDFWGAGASVLGALPIFVGDLAKTGKIAKGIDKISDAIDVAKSSKKTDFIVTPDGVAVPKSQKVMTEGFDKAGFPKREATQTAENGSIYTVPAKKGKVDVRAMEGSSKHPKRSVITHPNTNNPKTPSGKGTTDKKDNHIEQH